MDSILLPNKIQFTRGERPNEGVLTVEPCAQGYGTTLGNALRRVLLSSLPGAAIISVKIKGAEHEFSALPHVKEDVLEIILALKSVRIKLHADEPMKLTLQASGEKGVTAGDFEKNGQIEIVNPDMHIATLTDAAANLEMEVWVAPGRGYETADERATERNEIGMIGIDSLFSPILNVSYKVEATRVGEKTDFDKLVLRVETDGTMDPLEAVNRSVTILTDYTGVLRDLTYTEETS
jgi:DNA-directed RNA polymerase subunit alpha